jgi:predicted dehydrogenase
MEYGNGIVGDMCMHMLDTARWMLDLGWPKRISSSGGIFVQKEGKSNISDTQTATFEYDGLTAVGSIAPGARPDPDYPWA